MAGVRIRTPEKRRDRIAWIATPLFVFVFLGVYSPMLTKAIAAMIAVSIAMTASRRPDRALLVLMAVLPFQTVLLSYLFKLGVPGEVVRPLAAWKEAVGIGILFAAVKNILTGNDVRRRVGLRAPIAGALDRLDYVLLAFVGLTLLFALAPGVLAPDAPIGSGVRSLGFRSTAGFVLLFFAARHANLPADFGAKLRKVIVAVATIAAGVGAFEFFFDDTWNTFAIEQLGVIRYRVLVLNTPVRNFSDIRGYGVFGGETFVRIGSIFFSYMVAGFYLLVAFGLALEVIVRRGLRLGAALALTAIGAALMFTQTRAAILGAVIVALVAFRAIPGRPTRNRIRLALVLAAALVVLVPAAVSTGLVDRTTGAATGEDESASAHIDSFWRGIEALADAPMGHGLGTSAGIGQRFGSAGSAIVTENYYLQVGVELGIAGTVLFFLMTILIARTSTRMATKVGGDLAGARGAFIGLAVGAALLHTWNDVPVSWTAWGAAGALLGIAERRALGGTPYEPMPDEATRSDPYAPAMMGTPPAY